MPQAADPLARYDQLFEDAGREWDVDPLLLKAMAGQESRGKTDAVSKVGAQGLMQIMPQTQKDLGVTDPNDPAQSIFGAAKYMSQALDAEGSPEGALFYYHGGPDWRQKFGPESKGYVPAVAARYKALLAQQQQSQPPATQASAAPATGPQQPSSSSPPASVPFGSYAINTPNALQQPPPLTQVASR